MKNKQLCEGCAEMAPVEELVPVHPIHGSIDFRIGGIVLSFRVMIEGKAGPTETTIHIINDENGTRMQRGGAEVILGQSRYFLDDRAIPSGLHDRWDLGLLNSFVSDPKEPKDLFLLLKTVLARYLDFGAGAHQMGLVSVWAIATYFAHLFSAFPFLSFFGPKESGKSKVLEVLQQICFNAVKVKSISEAALGDTMDSQRATLLVDQSESLRSNLVGILADSYKRAGAKRRIVRIVKGKRSVQEFSSYGPKAFASTKELDPDLKDRCCQINMVRTTKSLPDLLGTELEWIQILDACHRFLLLRWQDVAQAYVEIPPTGTRRGELWRPLVSVLKVLDVPEEEIMGIKKVFEEGTARTQHVLDDVEEALFQVILDQAREEKRVKFIMKVPDISARMKVFLGKKEKVTPQDIGKKISLFALADDARKRTRHKTVHYLFDRAKVIDIAGRYLPNETLQGSDGTERDCQEASPGLEEATPEGIQGEMEDKQAGMPPWESLEALAASLTRN